MDEQQIIQLLNQIPLDILQNYLAQRMQQEQMASQQNMNMGQDVPSEPAPDATMVPPEPVNYGSYGGRFNGWSPDINLYSCGGSTRTVAARGRLGARKGNRR